MDWKGSKQLAVLDGAAKKFRNSSSGMKIAAKRAQECSHSRTASLLIWDFSLDEFRQQRQRFLPAKIARLDGNCRGHYFLLEVQFGAAGHLLQGDCRVHFAGQVRVVEFVGIADAFVGLQFEIGAAEGVAFASGEIGERHLVGGADFRVQVVNLGGESVRWKPTLPLRLRPGTPDRFSPVSPGAPGEDGSCLRCMLT